jgi:hypothetical protein
MPTMTPLAAVAKGLVAGAIGTLAMDLSLFARYKRGGGQDRFVPWETSSGLHDWDQAPAPAHVGKRLIEGLFQRELPATSVPLVNNATHWGYGILNSVQYAILAGSVGRPRVRYGLPFGAAVWASGYVILPAAKLYQPIWEYDCRTLANDLASHLVYGLGTAATFKALSRVSAA